MAARRCRPDRSRCPVKLPAVHDGVEARREQVAVVERARRGADAGLEERAVAEPRFEVDVEALIQVGLAAEVVREANQAVGRQVLREHRRLEVLHAAHLVAAAVRQVGIASAP